MLEILKYSFFQNALIGGILISIISSILGTYIVMRKEANITHAISNFMFLGVAISLLLNGNYYIYAFTLGIIASLLIFFIEKSKIITKESSKEIVGNLGLAGAIFCIGFLGNLSLDINNLLFGSILFISKVDLIILTFILLTTFFLFFFFGKDFLAVIINEDMAKSKGIKTNLYNLSFLVLLSFFIGVSIKIFGIMLLGAFLIIPANTGKILGKNIKTSIIITLSLSVFSVILGLFSSYFLGTNTGASIILILIFCFITSVLIKQKNKS